MTISNYLSIWEVAHRWHDINPDETDPEKLPTNIQDSIRYICRAVLNNDIKLFHLDIGQFEDKGCVSGFSSEVRPTYVNEIPSELISALSREYDKNALDFYVIEAEGFFNYCRINEQAEKSDSTGAHVDFPSFWLPLVIPDKSGENEDNIPETYQVPIQSLRPVQMHKLVCQAIAKTLWDIHPLMTITAMTKHNAILEYGNGKYYTGKNTLRDWLSEAAPEDVKKRRRPKGSKPNNDAA